METEFTSRGAQAAPEDVTMIRYSCDRCGCKIDPEQDVRFVVRMEAYAAMDPLCVTEEDDDRDHLLEIHEILERLADTDDEVVGDDVYQKRRYDLCADCYRKYMQDPIGQTQVHQLDFSEN